MSKSMLCAAVVIALLVGGSLPAQADSDLGTFGWHLAPGCEVVVLHVMEEDGIFILHGFGDLGGCGEPRRIPADGTAFTIQDGTIVIGFTMRFPGNAVHVNARLDPTTIEGPWVDDVGNTGILRFLGPR